MKLYATLTSSYADAFRRRLRASLRGQEPEAFLDVEFFDDTTGDPSVGTSALKDQNIESNYATGTVPTGDLASIQRKKIYFDHLTQELLSLSKSICSPQVF